MGGRAQFFWSAVRNWGTRFGSLAVFFVLVRLVPRDQLGAFAAANAVMGLIELFAENGIGDAVVQKTHITENELSAAFAFNLILGLATAAMLVLLAGPISAAMGTPRVAEILPFTAIAVFLNSLGYSPQAMLRRKFEFRWLAMRAMAATLVGGAVGIAMAFLGFGIWSMVAQLIVSAAINTIMVWAGSSWRPQFPVRFALARPLLLFGFSVFGGRILFYLSTRSIEIFIATVFGASAMALYIMGSRIAAVMTQLLSAVTLDVSLPSFSRLADAPEKLRAKFYGTAEMASAVVVSCFALVAALAEPICRIAYGENGSGSEAILMPFCLIGAVQIYQFLSSTIITAVGRPNIANFLLCVKMVIAFTAMFLTHKLTLQALILTYAAGEILFTPINLAIGARTAGFSLVKVLRLSWPFWLSSGLMVVVVRASIHALASHTSSSFIILCFGGIIGVVSYGVFSLLCARVETLRLAQKVLSRKS